MRRLPEQPSLDHLKRQAKDLLSMHRSRDRSAITRFRSALPAAAGKDDEAIAHMDLRLHDAQSCVAREHGFPSWADLKSFVEARSDRPADRSNTVVNWLRFVYAGGTNRARPSVAARILEERHDLTGDDPYLACATGDEAVLRQIIERDPTWVNQPGGPLDLPPLVAVAHSSLVRLPSFRDRLHAAARLLLKAGADPNQAVGSRWPPATLDAPSKDHKLSALYGAAGQNHDPELTRLLLDAGADPNDGESLYHSLENIACARLLLEAGARVTGSNALYRVLDLDNVDVLRLLLSHGGDPNEPATSSPTAERGAPLLWAIRRRRSPAHIAALLEAGADPSRQTPDGTSAYTWALRFGLPEIAELLGGAGDDAPVSKVEQFVAACARGDEADARHLQSELPSLPISLSNAQLRLLPELAAQGCGEAVRLMVRLGWPIAVRGGDWQASALNHAVFRGDANLTQFLLEHGASWTEHHGYGDNVCGTLGWASCNEPVEGGDWLGCAQVLVARGMPTAQPDPEGSGTVRINGQSKRFSDEVTDFLLGANS
jgi:ankyrin repeat protein